MTAASDQTAGATGARYGRSSRWNECRAFTAWKLSASRAPSDASGVKNAMTVVTNSAIDQEFLALKRAL